MRTAAAVLVTLLTLGPADALDRTETAAIQSAIRGQIEAFSRGDFVAAYARAAPGIQIQYQSPATFARLVQESYPALLQPRSYTFDAVRETPTGATQSVRIQDTAGVGWTARYSLERQSDDSWKINGCELTRTRARGR